VVHARNSRARNYRTAGNDAYLPLGRRDLGLVAIALSLRTCRRASRAIADKCVARQPHPSHEETVIHFLRWLRRGGILCANFSAGDPDAPGLLDVKVARCSSRYDMERGAASHTGRSCAPLSGAVGGAAYVQPSRGRKTALLARIHRATLLSVSGRAETSPPDIRFVSRPLEALASPGKKTFAFVEDDWEKPELGHGLVGKCG